MADVNLNYIEVDDNIVKFYAPGVLFGLSDTNELGDIEREISDVRSSLAWVCVDVYGAKGDGITDDTQAIQQAFDSGANVIFGKNKNYLMSGSIYISGGQNVDLNNSTITSSTAYLFTNCQSTDVTYDYTGHGGFYIANGTIIGGEVFIGHGHDIVLKNLVFRNSLGSHFIQIMSSNRVLIHNCSFIGLTPNPSNSYSESINLDPCDYSSFNIYGEGSDSYDDTPNKDITISSCYFAPGTDTGFDSLANAVGAHSYVEGQYHTDLKIINNIVDGASKSGFRTYAFRNALIMGNIVKSSSYALQLGHGDGLFVTNNKFVFTGDVTGNRSAVLFYYNEDNLALFNNEFEGYCNIYQSTALLNYNNKDITFSKVDPIVLASGTFGNAADIQLAVPYTTFDTLIIMNGYVSSNNMRNEIVRAWPFSSAADTFVIPTATGNGDEWPIDSLNTGATVLLKSDGKTIQVKNPGRGIRAVLGCRKTR